MPQPIRAMLFAFAVLCTACNVRAATLILEQFNQPVADNSPIGLATSWHAYAYDVINGVVTDYTTSTPNGNYPTISRANNGGFGGVTGNTVMATFGYSTPALFWTNSAATLQDCAVSNVIFYTKNNASSSTEQVAVCVGGNWYVSPNLFRDGGGNSVWASNHFAFTHAATSWRTLDTNTLTAGAVLTEPLPSGTIDAIGLYGVVPVTGKIRMDQFSVNGTAAGKPIVAQPAASPAASVTAPTTVTLDVLVTGVPVPFDYQWRKDGVVLANGPTGTGSSISGAAGSQMIVSTTSPADSGSYDVIVSNSYGSTTSAVLVVTVSAAGIPPSIDSISTVPANGVREVGGAPLSITVTASGTGPFSYEWFKGGEAIPGETEATLTVPAVMSSSGAYSVIVSSAYGSVTSAPPTMLSVVDLTAPVIAFPAGNPTNILLNTVFTPFYTVTDNSGETSNVSISGAVNTAVCGTYVLNFTAWDSSLNTNTATLTVNVWLISEPFNQATADNSPVSVAGWNALAVAAASGTVNDYTTVGGNANFPTISQNVTAPGAVNGAPGFLVMGDAVNANPSLVWKDTTVILQNHQLTELFFYTRNNSSGNTVQVAIRIHTNWYASTMTLTDTTGGAVPWASQAFTFSADPSAWQTLDPATLTLGAQLTEPLPNYSISAVGFFGAMITGKIRVDSVQASGVAATFPATPPSVDQPAVSPVSHFDGTAWSGTPLTFGVVAAGTPPLSYQWRKDGVNVAATADIWVLPDPSVADSGEYDVVVSNAGGSVTSAVVNVTVSAARLLVNQGFQQSTNDPGVIGQIPGWHAIALNLTNGVVTDFSLTPNPPFDLDFPNLARSAGVGGAPGYVVMGQGDTVNPVLIWTETPPALQSGRITNVLFYTRNALFSSTLQVSVQIGGQWYASTQPIQDMGGGVNWMPQSFTFVPDAGLWYTLDPATLLLGQVNSEPLPDLPVTGIGLFGEMFGVATARIRIDEFQVDGFSSVAPQPSIQPVFKDGSGNLVVRTATQPGWNYILESTPSLQAPVVWTPVSTNAGNGAVITNPVPIKSDAGVEFFRYRVQ